MTDTTVEHPEMRTEPTEVGRESGDTSAPAENVTAEDNDTRAGRYRRRLREAEAATATAEAERDQLREQVQTMQRAEVVRLAAEQRLQRPDAVWAAGLQLADLLGEDGQVDAGKVRAAVTAAVADLGLATRHEVKPDMSQGARGIHHASSDNPWAELLNRK